MFSLKEQKENAENFSTRHLSRISNMWKKNIEGKLPLGTTEEGKLPLTTKKENYHWEEIFMELQILYSNG